MFETMIEGMKSDDQKYLENLDVILSHLLDAETLTLIRRMGVEYVAKHLSMDRGRYRVERTAFLSFADIGPKGRVCP